MLFRRQFKERLREKVGISLYVTMIPKYAHIPGA
jgi:hypothetical protein